MTDPSPLAAQSFGNYEVIRVIGEGSFARVYEATELGSNRQVAIKVLRKNWLSNEAVCQRFMQEAKVLARLKHPSIVQIWDCLRSADGEPFLVMDYLRGQTLADMVDTTGPLSQSIFEPIFAQLSSAFDYAHKKQIIHRDVKLSNVFIENNSQIPKLLDFGIAKLAGEGAELTRSREMVGTPICMSPEQIRGETVTPATDVYGLGCLLYECLTGLPVFQSDALIGLYNRHLFGERPKLANALQVPNQLDDILAKALHTDPKVRFQSAGEFHEAFTQALAPKEPSSSRRPTQVLGITVAIVEADAAESVDWERVQIQADQELDNLEEDFAKCGFHTIASVPGIIVLGRPSASNEPLAELVQSASAKIDACNSKTKSLHFGLAIDLKDVHYNGDLPIDEKSLQPDLWIAEDLNGVYVTEAVKKELSFTCEVADHEYGLYRCLLN